MRCSSTAALLLSLVAACSGKPQRSPSVPEKPASREERATPSSPRAAPDPILVSSGNDPVVSLRTPHAQPEAVRLLQAYARAIAHESSAELGELLTEDASIRYGTQSQGGGVLSAWLRRFAQRDYQSVNPASLFDPEELELFTTQDVAAHPDAAGLVFTPQGSELVVRVPLTPTGAGSRFGDSLQLLLTPSASGLRIRRIYEPGYSEQ